MTTPKESSGGSVKQLGDDEIQTALSEGRELADELEHAAEILDVAPIGPDEAQLHRTGSRGFWRKNANRMRRAAELLRSLPSVSPRSEDVQKAMSVAAFKTELGAIVRGAALLEDATANAEQCLRLVDVYAAALESVQTAQPGSEQVGDVAFQTICELQRINMALWRALCAAPFPDSGVDGNVDPDLYDEWYAVARTNALIAHNNWSDSIKAALSTDSAPPQNTAQPRDERKMIDAPAVCDKCRTHYTSPTTGKVFDDCHCGGILVTVPESQQRICETERILRKAELGVSSLLSDEVQSLVRAHRQLESFYIDAIKKLEKYWLCNECHACSLSGHTLSTDSAVPREQNAPASEEAMEIPRRIRMDQWTPAEHAIQAAVDAVEVMGADERLTRAVVLLAEARRAVADFVDGVPLNADPPTEGSVHDHQ
jgi:hypothetical protein